MEPRVLRGVEDRGPLAGLPGSEPAQQALQAGREPRASCALRDDPACAVSLETYESRRGVIFQPFSTHLPLLPANAASLLCKISQTFFIFLEVTVSGKYTDLR